jgi:hypothetical protein
MVGMSAVMGVTNCMMLVASHSMVRVAPHMVVMSACHMVVVVALSVGMVNAVTVGVVLTTIGVMCAIPYRMVLLHRMVVI